MKICYAVIANNLNFKDLFYKTLPGDIFSTRATKAIGFAWMYAVRSANGAAMILSEAAGGT